MYVDVHTLFEGALLIVSNMGTANKHMIKNIYDKILGDFLLLLQIYYRKAKKSILRRTFDYIFRYSTGYLLPGHIFPYQYSKSESITK